MAEGISTSSQTCPSDPQGLFTSEGLSSPPPLSHLHVNDLGLTPSPGSQLQHFDASKGEQRGSSDRDVKTNSAQNAVHNRTYHAEDHSYSHKGDGNEEKPDHAPSDDGHGGSAYIDQSKGSPRLDVHSSEFNGANDTAGDLYDPLFDSDVVFDELDAAFRSQKRAGEEAFPEENAFWDQSRKRQATELIQGLTESPDKTPSLSSLDCSLQPDQGGTGPHTPVDIEKQQPPAMFESMDLLFPDPPFDVSLDIPDGEVPFNFDLQDAFNEQEQKEAASMKIEIPEEALGFDECDLPSVSEITKARFSLDQHHVIANTNREVLQRVYPEPEYVSPYPAHGGPLGYLPSTPGVHVRYVEVTDDRNSYRINCLRNKVQQLSLERNKYRQELSQLADLITVDPATGKTNQQLLLDQNAMLRRVCSRHQSRVEQYKQETIEWKNKLHDLGTTYNNLLYELRTQKEAPAVAPIPNGYKPPRVRQANPTQQSQSHLQPGSHTIPPTAQPPHLQPVSSSAPNAPASHVCQNIAPGSSAPRAEPLTIDLTEETGDDEPAPVMPTPEETQRRAEMLQSLRSKKYSWLGAEADAGPHSVRATPAPQAQGSPRAEGGPQDAGRSRGHAPAQASCEIASVDLADSDDDLARMMEQELTQS
ncbi:hypothetical protein BO70DRAFT_362285 [Aspergillus heteromorphus CBS 117.55]|uniref:Uncharacterized protein n=1 Tax=Aspergillus heteromorphus CBS 117.55 TaxID=1448321 RepID=A0A317WA31_9EURO|nr:uncharacterized protein BO70DRAFT_362285 [Aspergillus heteromorphus CBS 117.55]PWY81848.1 hypothetical protein BO70DRAFT_362285 [Aspergillus heteromorphus CBS 117.55]